MEDAGTCGLGMRFIRGAGAVSRLKGETYGVFGGRSMGMYTAAVDLAQWRRQFGIDIEHIDQGEIVRLSAEVPPGRVTRAREWLQRLAGGVRHSDAALTMEIFKHIARTPVLFADVRHYDAEYDFWDLVNSGQHATYFAGKSFNPEDNMPKVKLLPEIFYFPAGGASVFHIAQPGEVTLGRLTRKDGNYWMAILPAEFVELPADVAERKAAATTPEWPHAFARLKVPPDTFIETYSSNHIHGVYGNYVEDLIWTCKILGIDYRVYV